MRIKRSHARRFCFGALNRGWRQGGGNGFFRSCKDQVYFMMPTSKKLKKPCASKGWVGRFYAQAFLTLAPHPLKPLPIAAAHPGLCVLRTRPAVPLQPAVTARAKPKSGHGLCRGNAFYLAVKTAHRIEKGILPIHSHIRPPQRPVIQIGPHPFIYGETSRCFETCHALQP